jgi:hypothetical protein
MGALLGSPYGPHRWRASGFPANARMGPKFARLRCGRGQRSTCTPFAPALADRSEAHVTAGGRKRVS